MGLKNFFKKWGEGIKNLSPERQLKAQLSGGYGNIIGFSGGLITMSYMVFVTNNYHWWWTIFILFIALFTTVLDIIAKKQQLKAILDMQKQFEAMEKVAT